MDVQMQIRENTLELHEFLKDLKGWESTVKEKEKQLKSQPAFNGSDVTIPAPRKNPCSAVQDEDKGSHASAIGKDKGKDVSRTVSTSKERKSQAPVSKPGVTAASHTYDYFRDKWDTFDVDAALKEVDEENENEGEKRTKKVLDKVIPPARGSQSKRSKVGENSSKAEAVVKTQAMEPGKLFGRGLGTMDRLSAYDEGMPTASSEKELGNDYFKEGKYVRAIDCYSRSIALQPTAVAYANRAMAALKLRKYQEAENDCTEAISLDDRYTKAYARRGTARKELKKLLTAVEDFEFALRLEPENKELKKQYMEARELYEKSSGSRLSKMKVAVDVKEVSKQNTAAPQATVAAKSAAGVESPKPVPEPGLPVRNSTETGKAGFVEGIESFDANGKSKAPITQTDSASVPGTSTANAQAPVATSYKPQAEAKAAEQPKIGKKSVDSAAIQKAAARAAAVAAMTAVRKLAAPKTAYEFETMWKGFDGNRDAESRLIKVMDPASLPGVFKDSLGAAMLVEIIRCLELLFPDDASFAVQILEHLTKVGRFSMTVMFLSAKDKSDLGKLWDEVFMKASSELHPALKTLRAAYRLG